MVAILRWGLIVSVAAAPFPLACVPLPWARGFVALAAALGLASWLLARTRWQSARRPVPAATLLVGLNGVAAAALVPLPAGVLRLLSPGTLDYFAAVGAPVPQWHPVSVVPLRTASGLVLLAALSLHYAALAREFHENVWRRRLVVACVLSAVGVTAVALAQVAVGSRAIYGLVEPAYSAAVYGPFVNRIHYAAWVAAVVPAAGALVVESWHRGVERARRRRRLRWLALVEGAGGFVPRVALLGLLLIGLLGSGSRWAPTALAGSIVAAAILRRRQSAALAALGTVWVAGWLTLNAASRFLEGGGYAQTRLQAWADMVTMAARYPLLGAGLNASTNAVLPYQRWNREAALVPHSEYVQVVAELGVAGIVLAGLFLRRVLAAIAASMGGDPMRQAVAMGTLCVLMNSVVQYVWPVPANLALAAALAALAMSPGRSAR